MRAALLAVMIVLASSSLASAHGFEIGVLALHELEPGRFAMRWRAPEDSRRATPVRVTIRFPEHCRREQHELRCGAEGLHGAIAFDDLPDPRTPIVVRIERLDGRRIDAVVRGESASLDVGRASATVAAIEQGVRCVLGLDHLLVLFALVLVVGVERRALPALAALVGGHALGLALEVSSLPSAPLAAASMAGVVLLARGAARDDEARPWLAFALVLGATLGLARAEEVPVVAIAGAALTDVVLLALLALVLRAARSWIARRPVRMAAAYAAGVAGAVLLIAHTSTIATGLF